ncbi:MAG: 2-succinyl-6-hydroxy-2,4-cyclohexadiene-1-carboxylate synthase [Microcoleus sp. PH2017_22_RUC_O_B]|uniref:2-succinyl-6-hydroxy-2, 4-cyclohexadiene-1-carboxylate synthase n=1 Tax=unclassified Microcoleus TaxID=2642155 RepID=UPI001D2CF573|nr:MULTISPECIES: 2-succinyl-6-hydroxy-2,4-cyclohexadiene-1-carboxylate synthase [unclassified Microcoleus]MCC3529617.1 2-succinyl-6-hydroxy-2,4-cyclohexadiene-1-carboxylate synthase [Microcoleus sp. PH2017_21_RUC_O_A]MCC3541749.1 2-succinyl-6-hydroxy-2,4-cyclohexadiene-1-carboxylate synthase [Microcoleus sp. PH2017_22_RUC_O_B]
MNKSKKYQFHYSLTGNKNQSLILLLHGFTCDSQDFDQIISLLSQSYCCLAVDLPGHGKTKVTGDESCYNMSNTAQALIHLLDNLQIDKCLLLGYSMGGRLALYMTLHFPDRFEKVVLESASGGLKSEKDRSRRRQADSETAQNLENSNIKDFILNWYDRPLFKSLKKSPKFEKLIESRLANNPLELAKSLRNMGTGNQPSLWEKLAQNQIPLLLLAGEDDDKFQRINAEIASLCPAATLKIIPNAGHNIHFENIDDFASVVRQFYD